ncbi:MAG: hypothetical protein PVH73_05040 [Candidatus Bathyarchaeota archaeon]|jgi:hypothetical protein
MKKAILAMLFALFLLSAMTVPSLSQDLTVGVSVGDTFTYEGDWFHDVTSGGTTIPNQLVAYQFWNETDSVTRTVIDVADTMVTFENEFHFSNGSSATNTTVEDVANPGWVHLCVGANMEPGDTFYYDETYLVDYLTFNSTVMWGYETDSRETLYHQSTTAAWATVVRQYWFDKETGILVKAQLDAGYDLEDQNSTTGTLVELVDTSIWVIPEFPTGTAMLLVFVAVTVCVNIYRRKKLKRRIG